MKGANRSKMRGTLGAMQNKRTERKHFVECKGQNSSGQDGRTCVNVMLFWPSFHFASTLSFANQLKDVPLLFFEDVYSVVMLAPPSKFYF